MNPHITDTYAYTNLFFGVVVFLKIVFSIWFLANSPLLGVFFPQRTDQESNDPTAKPLPLRIFLSTCVIFAWYQLASMCCLYMGVLSSSVSIGILVLPTIIVYAHTTKNPSKLHPLTLPNVEYYVFLPLILVYFFHASVTPWMRDSLTYHLALPRLYSIAGSFTETDSIIFAYFPRGWQSILTLFHTLGPNNYGVFNPRYISTLLTFSISLGIIGILQEKYASNTISISLGTLFLLIPTVFEFATSCYVDIWLTCIILCAMYAYQRNLILVTGALIGVACSIKYSGLFCIPIFLLFYMQQSIEKKEYYSLVRFVLALVITGFPFYLDNWVHTGNPVFPLLFDVFPSEPKLWDSWRTMAYEITLDNYGMGRSVGDTIALSWRIFFTLDMTHSFQGSLGWSIGILFYMVIWKYKTISFEYRVCFWFVCFWILLWINQVQQIRFLLPMIPILLLSSAPVLKQYTTKRLHTIVLTIACFWAIQPIQTLIEEQHTLDYWQLYIDNPTTSDHEYLSKQLPENYPVEAYLNQEIQVQKVWLVWMRGYNYYLQVPSRLDSVFEGYRFENLLWNSTTPTDFLSSLHQDNISHIAINWRFFLTEDSGDRIQDGANTILQQRFGQLITHSYLIPIQNIGPVWIYSVSESDTSSSTSVEWEAK